MVPIVLGLSSFSGCLPSEADDPPSDVQPTGTRLPQESVIPIEVWTGDDWMTIDPSQLGMERFAQQWCSYQRTFVEDDKVCGAMATSPVPPPPGILDLPQNGSELGLCKVALCFQRNEVCAGYMLEELGRSPLQRELDAASFDSFVSGSGYPALNVQLGDLGLQIPKSELDVFGKAARTGSSARRFRFQPVAAEGRAAAFRGGLNRFRDAGRWAHEIRTFPLSGGTCLQHFESWISLGSTTGRGFPTSTLTPMVGSLRGPTSTSRVSSMPRTNSRPCSRARWNQCTTRLRKLSMASRLPKTKWRRSGTGR